MPLTELMNYFNDQLQAQARLHELPKTGFYKADNQYWARFGNLILGSQFADIISTDQDRLIGHYADLFVRSSAGNVLNIDDIVNALDDKQQIIHLDRLVRTLHSLNYLQQHDGFKGLVALRVQARHILSVANEHGKTFEKILSDCGLGPERVVLHTRLLDVADFPHFYQALTNYRNRQYLIGISVHDLKEWELQQQFELVPDYIFASSSLQPKLRELPQQKGEGKPILVIDNPESGQYNLANNYDSSIGYDHTTLDGKYSNNPIFENNQKHSQLEGYEKKHTEKNRQNMNRAELSTGEPQRLAS